MSAQQPNPYAPPTAHVSDAVYVGDDLQVAGRGTRLGAAILDSIIMMAFMVPAFVIGGGSLMAAFGSGVEPGADAMFSMMSGPFIAVALLCGIAYAGITAVLVHRNGQTMAKKLFGIKVVRKDGSRATLSRIFWLRNVVNGLPSLIPFVGNLYVFIDSLFIFTESNQCIHDKIADTIVVKA